MSKSVRSIKRLIVRKVVVAFVLNAITAQAEKSLTLKTFVTHPHNQNHLTGTQYHQGIFTDRMVYIKVPYFWINYFYLNKK